MATRSEYETRRDAVAALIVSNPHRFDMFSVTGREEECGTTHCIAGWALVHKFNLQSDTMSDVNGMAEAEEYLGLDPGTPLFVRFDFSPEDAALALKSAPYLDCEE
jgi:hypothetical protein